MDYSLQSYQSFIGRPVTELPTPSLVLSRPILEKNINQLLQDVKDLDITFRPHVKTLKVWNGLHRKIVASTLCEIRGAIPLVKEGILDECLYGLPIYPSALPHLEELSKSIRIVLMIDNEQHIDVLEQYINISGNAAPWPVFIKVDVGSHRAGLENSSPFLPRLVQRVETSTAASIEGFYCHAGHSYGCRTPEAAAAVLQTEIEGVVRASKNVHLSRDRRVIVSVGSTPTAHVVNTLRKGLPDTIDLELHAGNYPANDLQQVCTSLISESQQAIRILAEICSVYPERNEALINAGTVALSKETSDSPGFGRIVAQSQWSVLRMAQEHGILGTTDASQEKVAETFRRTMYIT
ncbi:hypothetical protein EYZ11_007865 [Aspergillus tanneri]|uniref:D-serine dehydratase n=1 Tax=Aspergillus tanneri TaxID=1220188 RepID=A0A4S3JBX6_9EURO|nr:hypothetical protein EYZ11_007865 [Aspergillus tanneri]